MLSLHENVKCFVASIVKQDYLFKITSKLRALKCIPTIKLPF